MDLNTSTGSANTVSPGDSGEEVTDNKQSENECSVEDTVKNKSENDNTVYNKIEASSPNNLSNFNVAISTCFDSCDKSFKNPNNNDLVLNQSNESLDSNNLTISSQNNDSQIKINDNLSTDVTCSETDDTFRNTETSISTSLYGEEDKNDINNAFISSLFPLNKNSSVSASANPETTSPSSQVKPATPMVPSAVKNKFVSPTFGITNKSLTTVLGKEQIKKRLQSFSLMKQGIQPTPVKKILRQTKGVMLGEQSYDENGEKKNEKVFIKKPAAPKKGPNPQEKAKALIDEIEEIKRTEAAKFVKVWQPMMMDNKYKFGFLSAKDCSFKADSDKSKSKKKSSRNSSEERESSKDRSSKHKDHKKDRRRRSSEKEEKKKTDKYVEDEKMPDSWIQVKEKDMDFDRINRIKEKFLRMETHKNDNKDKHSGRRRFSPDVKRSARKEDIIRAQLLIEEPSMPRQPYVVYSANANEKTKDFPQNIIRFTHKSPSISFCENPEYATSYHQTRQQLLQELPRERAELMLDLIEHKKKLMEPIHTVNSTRNWYPNKEYLVESKIVYGKSTISYGLSVLSESYLDDPDELTEIPENKTVSLTPVHPSFKSRKDDSEIKTFDKQKSKDTKLKEKDKSKSCEQNEIKEKDYEVQLPNGNLDDLSSDKEVDKTPNTDEYRSNWESDEDIIDMLAERRSSERKSLSLDRSYDMNWDDDEERYRKKDRRKKEEKYDKDTRAKQTYDDSKKYETKKSLSSEQKKSKKDYDEKEDRFDRKKHEDVEDKYERKLKYDESEDFRNRDWKSHNSEERYDKKKYEETEDKYERKKRVENDVKQDKKTRYDESEEARNKNDRRKRDSSEDKHERKLKVDESVEAKNKYERRKSENADEKCDRKGKHDESEDTKNKHDVKKQDNSEERYEKKSKHDESQDNRNKYERKKNEEKKYENNDKQERKSKRDEFDEYRDKLEKKKQSNSEERYQRKISCNENEDFERKRHEEIEDNYVRKIILEESEEFKNRYEQRRRELSDDKFQKKTKYDENEEYKMKERKKEEDDEEKSKKKYEDDGRRRFDKSKFEEFEAKYNKKIYDEMDQYRDKYEYKENVEDRYERKTKQAIHKENKYEYKEKDNNENNKDKYKRKQDIDSKYERNKQEISEEKGDKTRHEIIEERYSREKNEQNEEFRDKYERKCEGNEDRARKKYMEDDNQNKYVQRKSEEDNERYELRKSNENYLEVKTSRKISETKSEEGEKYIEKRASYVKMESEENNVPRRKGYEQKYTEIEIDLPVDKRNKPSKVLLDYSKEKSYSAQEKTMYNRMSKVCDENELDIKDKYNKSDKRSLHYEDTPTSEIDKYNRKNENDLKVEKGKSKEKKYVDNFEEHSNKKTVREILGLKKPEINNSWSTDEETEVCRKKETKIKVKKKSKNSSTESDSGTDSDAYRTLYRGLKQLEDHISKKQKKKKELNLKNHYKEQQKKLKLKHEKYINKVQIDYTDYEKNLEDSFSWYQKEKTINTVEPDIKPRNKIKIDYSDFDHPLLESDKYKKKDDEITVLETQVKFDDTNKIKESSKVDEVNKVEEINKNENVFKLDEKISEVAKDKLLTEANTNKGFTNNSFSIESEKLKLEIELKDSQEISTTEQSNSQANIPIDIAPVAPPVLPIPSPIIPSSENTSKLVSEYEEFMKAVCFDSTQEMIDNTIIEVATVEINSTLDISEDIPEESFTKNESENSLIVNEGPKIDDTIEQEKSSSGDESESSDSENSDSSSYISESDSSASSRNSPLIEAANIKKEKLTDEENEYSNASNENRKRKYDSEYKYENNFEFSINRVIKQEKLESEHEKKQIKQDSKKTDILFTKESDIRHNDVTSTPLIHEKAIAEKYSLPVLPENIPLPNEISEAASSTTELQISNLESSPVVVNSSAEITTPSPVKRARSIIPIKLLTAETRKQANESASNYINTDDTSGFGILPIKTTDDKVSSSDSLSQESNKKIASLYEGLPTIELQPTRKRQSNVILNISPVKKMLLETTADDEESDEDFTERFMKHNTDNTVQKESKEKENKENQKDISLEEKLEKLIEKTETVKEIDSKKKDIKTVEKIEEKKHSDKEKIDDRKHDHLRSEDNLSRRSPKRTNREKRERSSEERRKDRITNRDRTRRESLRDKRSSTERRRDARHHDYGRDRELRNREIRRSRERDRRSSRSARNRSRERDERLYRSRRESRKYSRSPSPRRIEVKPVYGSPPPLRSHDDTDFSTTSMDIVQSPVNSPLDGFKRSLADSTISDSELSKRNIQEESTENSPRYNIPPLPIPARTSESPASPKRISLDDRINQVLGIEKEPPKPIGTVCSRGQYDTGHQPTYQENYPYGRTEYDAYNACTPDGYGQQYGNQYPPSGYQQYHQGINENNIKVLQVGNVIQVVPTEHPPPPSVAQPALPKVNLSEMPPKVVQVGNMLQIVPMSIIEEPPVSSPSMGNSSLVPQGPPPPLPDSAGAGPPPKTTEQLMLERRAEKEKRRQEREERRQEKEKKRKEKEKRRQLKIKLKTENMIKRALMLETGEADPDGEDVIEAETIDIGESRITSLPWPPVSVLGSLSLGKTPSKGILVSQGFSKQNIQTTTEEEKEIRKIVKFADGICPGEGTSPSGGEELPSPPPPKKLPKEKRFQKKLKNKKKIKVKIIRTQPLPEEEDDSDDDLPPPPPPPGSPPPHLWPPRIKPVNNINPQIPTSVYPASPFPQTVLYPPAFPPTHNPPVPLNIMPPTQPPPPPPQQSPRHQMPVLPAQQTGMLSLPPGPPQNMQNMQIRPPGLGPHIHSAPPPPVQPHGPPPIQTHGPPPIQSHGPPSVQSHGGPPMPPHGGVLPPTMHPVAPPLPRGGPPPPPPRHCVPPPLPAGPPRPPGGPPPLIRPPGPPPLPPGPPRPGMQLPPRLGGPPPPLLPQLRHGPPLGHRGPLLPNPGPPPHLLPRLPFHHQQHRPLAN